MDARTDNEKTSDPREWGPRPRARVKEGVLAERTAQGKRATQRAAEQDRQSGRKAPATGLDSEAMRRVTAAEAHARKATGRDRRAERRDLAAEDRDRAAEARDLEIEDLEAILASDEPLAVKVSHRLMALRGEAAQDRVLAARDRQRSSRDRARAAAERALAVEALHGAHFDELTGTYRRGLGKDVLRSEIERARRLRGPLVLGIVDVDGLKRVNDTEGHLAGDQLLRDVVAAIRANIRAYEPIVRLGGDEFAFTIGGLAHTGAEERCALIRADLARRPSRGRFSVGLAVLEDDDELADLMRRADAELVQSRPAHKLAWARRRA
jgi:diguanylate cyclase (GGDEF)-like protein